MQTKENLSVAEKYRTAWLHIRDIKIKRDKIEEIRDHLSPVKYMSLLEECDNELSEKSPLLNNEKDNAIKEVETISNNIFTLEKKINDLSIKLKDNEVLFSNSIIQETEYYKQKKDIEIEQSVAQEKLDEELISKKSIELILEYPDPEEEAKKILENNRKELFEKQEEERIRKEELEFEEAKKYDFEFQFKKAEEEIKIKALKKFNAYKMESETTINKLKEDFDKKIAEINQLNNEYKKLLNEYDELKSENDLLEKKYNALKQKFDKVYEAALNRKYPCGDNNCEGFIGLEGFCDKCGLNYEESNAKNAKKYYVNSIKEKIAKKKRTFKFITVFIIIVFLLSLSSAKPDEPIIVLFILFVYFLFYKRSTFLLEAKIFNCVNYGIVKN